MKTNAKVGSTAVRAKNQRILDIAVRILKAEGPLTPTFISEIALEKGLMMRPRGRTRGYLTQLIQSVLYNNSEYSQAPDVYRPCVGEYDVISRD